MAQPARHPVPDHGPTDCSTDHKSHFGTQIGAHRQVHRQWRIGGAGAGQVDDDGAASRPATPLHPRREVVAAGQSGGSGQQREISGRRRSGRQFDATLATPGRQDRAPGAGTHAQPEPVGPRAATVVRLERTLALAHGCRSPGAVVRVDMGEGAQECPPVGGRRPEPRRPGPEPSKPASRVTVRATRRYIDGACLQRVLVAAPQAC